MSLTLNDMGKILNNLNFDMFNLGWRLSVYETKVQGPWFRVEVRVPDSRVSGEYLDLDIKSPIPTPLIHGEEDFVDFIRWKLEEIAVHEVHEFLTYTDGTRAGNQVYDPHDHSATEPSDSSVQFFQANANHYPDYHDYPTNPDNITKGPLLE